MNGCVNVFINKTRSANMRACAQVSNHSTHIAPATNLGTTCKSKPPSRPFVKQGKGQSQNTTCNYAPLEAACSFYFITMGEKLYQHRPLASLAAPSGIAYALVVFCCSLSPSSRAQLTGNVALCLL